MSTKNPVVSGSASILAAAFTLCGCVHLAPDVMTEVAAPGELRAPPGKAAVVLVRPSKYPGVYPTLMDEKGRFLADLHGGAYVSLPVDPGERDFIVFAENAEMVRANVVAGKVYVIEVFGAPGVWGPRFYLSTDYKGAPKWPYPRSELVGLTATTVGPVDEAQQALDTSGNKEKKLQQAAETFASLKGDDLRKHTINPEDGTDGFCEGTCAASISPPSLPTPPRSETEPGCVPKCRRGYACTQGQCVPEASPPTSSAPTAPAACLPPCRRGFTCRDGRCEAIATAAPVSPTPSSRPAAAPESAAESAADLAPRIVHTPIKEATKGLAITVKAGIFPKTQAAVFDPKLLVRVSGLSEFVSLPMHREGDGFIAEIPGALVDEGLGYYIEAFDAEGNGPGRVGSPAAPLTVAVRAAEPNVVDRPLAVAAPSPPPPVVSATPDLSEEPRGATPATSTRTVPKIVAVSTGGLAVVSLVVGTILGVSVSNQNSQINAAIQQHNTFPASQYSSAAQTATFANVSFVAAGVLAAAAATFAVIGFRKPSSEN